MMNDADIIKALECCSTTKGGNCKECPFYAYEEGECQQKAINEAHELSQRQQAEIEQFRLENRVLSQNRITMPERLEIVNNARDKAIKEFAEKLKANFAKLDYKTDTHRKTCDVDFCDKTANWIIHDITSAEIDNLVKEMTSGEDDDK